MLLSEFVEVGISTINCSHYEKLGYKIPKREKKNGKFQFEKGIKIKVRSCDLTKSSLVPVELQCDYCGEKFPRRYKDFLRGRKVIDKDACKKCTHLKCAEISEMKYGKGIKYPMQQSGVAEKVVSQTRLAQEYVDNVLSKKDLILLSEYKNNNTPIRFICLNHLDKGIQESLFWILNNSVGCKYCGLEAGYEKHKHKIKDIVENFDKLGFVLLDTEYKDANTPMKCYCKKHSDIVQEKYYNAILKGFGCKYCQAENSRGENHYNWNGGKSALDEYLRSKISQWKTDSMRNCDYKCILTNSKEFTIHHLYSFSKIVDEMLEILQLPLYEEVNQYSDNELKLIEEKCLELHYTHGLGICIRTDLHVEFHSKYGWQDFSESGFWEFIKYKKEELQEAV